MISERSKRLRRTGAVGLSAGPPSKDLRQADGRVGELTWPGKAGLIGFEACPVPSSQPTLEVGMWP